MSEYIEKFKDPRWQKKRLEIMQRDNWKCRCCGQSDKTMNVHHLYYSPDIENPWEYPDNVMISLCEECHAEAHDKPTYIPGQFKTLIQIGIITMESIEKLWDDFVNASLPSERE